MMMKVQKYLLLFEPNLVRIEIDLKKKKKNYKEKKKKKTNKKKKKEKKQSYLRKKETFYAISIMGNLM